MALLLLLFGCFGLSSRLLIVTDGRVRSSRFGTLLLLLNKLSMCMVYDCFTPEFNGNRVAQKHKDLLVEVSPDKREQINGELQSNMSTISVNANRIRKHLKSKLM